MTVEAFPTGPEHWLNRCIKDDSKAKRPLPILANALIALQMDLAISRRLRLRRNAANGDADASNRRAVGRRRRSRAR